MDSDGFWWILVDSGGFWWILFPLVSISCRSHFDLSATVACVHWLPVLTGCLRSMVACVHWMPAFTGCLRSLVACVHWLPAFAGCLCSLVACVHWLPVFTWFPNGSVKKLLGILCWDNRFFVNFSDGQTDGRWMDGAAKRRFVDVSQLFPLPKAPF